MSDLTVREIAERLTDAAEAVCAELLPLGRAFGGEWIEAPKARGGLGDSLSVALRPPKRGVWHHRAAGVGGDLLDLVGHVHGLDKAGAVAWAKSFLGIADGAPLPPRPPPPPPARSEVEARARRIDQARAIWREARAADGTPAETYLRARAILGPIPPTIRFHPGLEYTLGAVFEGRRKVRRGPIFPALVAAVQGPSGHFVGVWRIYLSPTGHTKAAVDKPKVGKGVVAGGAVRLGPVSRSLVLTEGVETALSVLAYWPDATVWACLSTSGLTGFMPPEGVREIVVAQDDDPPCQTPGPMYGRRPGEEAARNAVERFRAMGLRATAISTGRPSADVNDLVNEP